MRDVLNHYQDELKEQVSQGRKRHEIIRNFYILRPSCTFTGKYDYAEKIMEEIASYFSIPLNCILVSGSAQLGFSLAKNTVFSPGSSDLDLAIIDPGLFIKYFDNVLRETNNYNKNQMFIPKENKVNYLNFVSKGVINPKYMPNCDLKRELKNFFTSVSSKYRDYYASVSVCFYMSEYAFQRKQQSALSSWITNYQQNLIGSEK